MKKKTRLKCACCGQDAGVWHQHWNRDKGYGVCNHCVYWLHQRNMSDEYIKDSFGDPNINYEYP